MAENDSCADVICEHSGTCVNLVNHFTCTCQSPWTGRYCQCKFEFEFEFYFVYKINILNKKQNRHTLADVSTEKN